MASKFTKINWLQQLEQSASERDEALALLRQVNAIQHDPSLSKSEVWAALCCKMQQPIDQFLARINETA